MGQPVAEVRPDRQHRAAHRAPRLARDAYTATSAKVQRDRRLRLVHGDLGGVHPRVGHAGVGDPAATSRCRFTRLAGDDRRPALRPARRSRRCRRGRRSRGGREVEPQRRRRRRSPARRGARARRRRGGRGPQPAQRDPVSHALRDRCASTPVAGRRHRDRVQRRAHLVHPHPPGPVSAASTVIAVVASSRPSAGARRAVRRRRAARRGTTCATRRPAPGSPSATQARSSRGAAAPSCARRSWRTRGRGRARSAPRRRRPRRAASTRASSSAAHLGDHVVVVGQRVHVGAVPAPVHQDPRHPGVGDHARPSSGSASPPETSLTIRAPASSAAAATAARWCRR